MDTTSSFPTIESRIQKAAEVLKITETEFKAILKTEFGIDPNEEGLLLLNAETTTEEVITEAFKSYLYPKLAKLALPAILKGRNPFNKPIEPAITNASWQINPTTTTSNQAALMVDGTIIANQFIELTKGLRDSKQMKDKELLEMYDRDRDYEIEQELHRRACFQHFIVLKPGPTIFDTSSSIGRKAIDIDMSLDLLKRSRRMVNPTIVRQGDVFVNVYRITELNPEDQIIEICPFCGKTLYKGYCEACNSDLSGMSDNAKAFIKLITELDSYEKADRRDVLVSAGKGLDDLRKTWPRAAKKYDELSLVNGLPRLKISRNLPSSKPADPFHVKN